MALKQSQGTAYLKVLDNSVCKQVPGDGVEFTVGWEIFANHQARINSETDPFVGKLMGTHTFDFFPELPKDWEPINQEKIQSEKMTTRCYLAIATLPEFEGWVNYQPEVVL